MLKAACQSADPRGVSSTDVSALRSALLVSPENVPLRLHRRRRLPRKNGSARRAEYREALRVAPHDEMVMLGLAECVLAQGRLPEALDIATQLADRDAVPGRTHLLLARIYGRSDRVEEAREEYRQAVAADLVSPIRIWRSGSGWQLRGRRRLRSTTSAAWTR